MSRPALIVILAGVVGRYRCVCYGLQRSDVRRDDVYKHSRRRGNQTATEKRERRAEPYLLNSILD